MDAGIPAWGIQPSVALRCRDGSVLSVPGETIELALDRGLQPVVYGDVALDEVRGGTIASTEEIFARLALRLHPERLVLAGEVDGIYSADPLLDHCAERIPVITRTSNGIVTGQSRRKPWSGCNGWHGGKGGTVAGYHRSAAWIRRNRLQRSSRGQSIDGAY